MKKQTCPDIENGKELGTVTDPEINEASGLVASQTYSGIFWTFNDSGGPNCIYALVGNGSRVFKLCLEGTVFDFCYFALALRAQSFTSLKADLRQDIHEGSAFSRCRNGTFP